MLEGGWRLRFPSGRPLLWPGRYHFNQTEVSPHQHQLGRVSTKTWSFCRHVILYLSTITLVQRYRPYFDTASNDRDRYPRWRFWLPDTVGIHSLSTSQDIAKASADRVPETNRKEEISGGMRMRRMALDHANREALQALR